MASLDKNPAAHVRQDYDQGSVSKTIDVASGRAWVCPGCRFVMHRDQPHCGNCGSAKPDHTGVKLAASSPDLFGGAF